ncbi:MFS transporter [Cronobacter dublinensis]
MTAISSLRADRSLQRLALLIAYIQFTNALEYMIFNPVFSYMAPWFNVPVTWAGYVTGIYTLAAVIAGLTAWLWIEKRNQRRFLAVSMAVLGALTLLILLTDSFAALLALRFIAGLTGGTTMGVASALLINAVPAAARPRALATVIAAFAVVSIVGMPGVLFICEHYHWQAALGVISVLCFAAIPFIFTIIPPSLPRAGRAPALPLTPSVVLVASTNALAQFSAMLIIPVLVPVLTGTLHASGASLPWLFVAGGVAGFAATRLTGKLLLHVSGFTLSVAASLVLMLSLLLPGFGVEAPWLFMALFLAASYARLVASSAVAMRFAQDRWRASFTSLQTALMSLATTAAFVLCSLIFPPQGITPGALQTLLWIAGSSALLLPVSLKAVERWLLAREEAPGA